MNGKKLTRRQLEMLYAIEGFISKNGISPTIAELKKALGVASDQSVYQLLQKLVEAGLVTREPGKRRSIRLVNQDASTAGMSKQTTYNSPRLASQAFTLDPTQKEIYNKLHDIDPQVAIIFKGAIFTMSQKAYHPDWIPQVANAIRHVFGVLTRLSIADEKDKKSAKKRENSSGIQKIGKVFDHYGNITSVEKSIWAQWNKLNEDFTSFSHYTAGYQERENQFLKKIDELYELLLQYVLPNQHQIYEKIDSLIAKGPDKASANEIGKILSRNTATYLYFFKKVDLTWFDFLKKYSFLKPTAAVGEYLCKLASQIPEKITDLCKKYDSEYKMVDKTKFIRHYFVKAAIKMPNKYVVHITGVLVKKKWIQNMSPGYDFLIFEVKKLLKRLIEIGEIDTALLLIENTLDIHGDLDKKNKLRDVSGFANNYQYGEILELIQNIDLSCSPRFITVLIDKLRKAIDLSEDKGKYSEIWRPSIKGSERYRDDVTDLLIDGVIRLTTNYLDNCTKEGKNISNEISHFFEKQTTNPIFTRILLHLYKKYSDDCIKEIQIVLIRHFDKLGLDREYDELLKETFHKLDKSTQKKYLALVEIGPADKGIENKDEYKRYWQIRKLILVKICLNKEWEERYKELLGDEEDSRFEPIYAGITTSWAGPTSPKVALELSTISIKKLVDYLANWIPKEDFRSPSRLGLGRELTEVVKGRSEKYSKNALLFQHEKLHPIYLYQYLYGLKEALKNKEKIDWGPVIELMKIIAERGKASNLANFSVTDDDWNIGWSNCFQYMADLLKNGLSTSKNGIPFKFEQDVFEIIEYICENKEPDLDYEEEYGGTNSNCFHLSINTARGEGFHALFNYIFWHDRNAKSKGKSRIPEKAKKILMSHLDIEKEPGLTIRSVYGRFFTWLLTYDKEWTVRIINKLFPITDRKRRYAAWETYLLNAVNPIVFEELRPIYKISIAELRKNSILKVKRTVDVFERLTEHLMIAYLYEAIDEADELLADFNKIALHEQKGNAVSFIGRVFIASKNAAREKEPSKKRLKLFWETKLNEYTSTEELKGFGWWIDEGFFDDEWMLEMLLKTLEKSKGIIDPDYRVLKTLNKLSNKYPILISECLLRMVKARYQDKFSAITREKSVLQIVKTLRSSDSIEVKKLVSKISDQMLRLGNDDFREFIE